MSQLGRLVPSSFNTTELEDCYDTNFWVVVLSVCGIMYPQNPILGLKAPTLVVGGT